LQNGEVLQSTKKWKYRGAGKVSGTKLLKRVDEKQKVSSSKHGNYDENNRVSYSFPGISCLWSDFL
jgi:[histone H3]-dimethyl-L-lysine9 demethylase